MNQDINFVVQAFWVKCREIIRPEIDAAVSELRGSGNDASVSSQEYSSVPDRLPAEVGPSLTLTLRPHGAADSAVHPAIQFHGDPAREMVEVRTSAGAAQSYELAALDERTVRSEIDDWLGKLMTRAPAR